MWQLQQPQRRVGREDLVEGARRFIVGLGKKVLIANQVAAPIEAQLEIWRGQARQGSAHLHLLERWRERLLASARATSSWSARISSGRCRPCRGRPC